MNISKNNYSSIEQMTGQLLTKNTGKTVKKVPNSKTSFEAILESKKTQNSDCELKFSKHANERLASRNIDLSQSQRERLENATKKAWEKGIHESLVMVDNLAFIVNVKNKTVITALNEGDDKVFTNIDGAVII